MNVQEELKWDFTDGEIGSEAVTEIETFFDVVLPADYIECALMNHGGVPNRYVFEFEGHDEDVFNRLLSLNSQETRYLINVYHNVQDRLVDKVFPFADTAFGDLICFDYRQGKENPRIAFWDHEAAFLDKESGILPICDTFTEFLAKLRPLQM